MSSFLEWVKKEKEKEKEKKDKVTITAPPSTSSSKNTSSDNGSEDSPSFLDWTSTEKSNNTVRNSPFLSWVQNKRYGTSFEDWISGATGFASEVQDRYKKWDTDEGAYKKYTSTADTLLSFADQWKEKYADNEEVVSYIDEVVSLVQGTKTYASQYYDQYSQFGSEAEYNEAVKLSDLYGMSSEEILPHIDDYNNSQSEKEEDISALQKKKSELEAKIKKWKKGDKSVFPNVEKYKEAEAEVKRLNNVITQTGKKEYGSPIAYTTMSGQNITWQDLYDQKKAEEDFNALYTSVSSNGDFNASVQAAKGYKNPDINTAEKGESIINKVTYVEENDIELRFGEANGGGSSIVHSRIGLMTEEEKNIYHYYFGRGEYDKADEYLASLDATLQERFENEEVEGFKRVAEELPVTASVMSVFASVLSGGEYIKNTINYWDTGELDNNRLADVSTAIREEVSSQVDWEIGGWDAFDFVYNTGMSLADSMVATTAFGYGGALILGLSAAAQSTNDALERGMSNEDAFWTGLTSGIFETLFETVSIGNLKAMKGVTPKNFKAITKNVAISMGVNFTEETLTEVANVAYDKFMNADFSQVETSVRMHMAAGMSEEEARAQAKGETLGRIVEAGASGALMGFATGGFYSGVGHAKYRSNATKTGQNIIANDGYNDLKALAMDVSAAESGIKDIDKAVAKADKKQTAWNVGRVSAEVDAVRFEKNLSEVKSALVENGMSQRQADKIAPQIIEVAQKQNSGVEITQEDYAAITKNEAVYAVYSSLISNPDSSVNSRNRQHTNARSGIITSEDGSTELSDAAQKRVANRVAQTVATNKIASESRFEANTGIVDDTADGVAPMTAEEAAEYKGKTTYMNPETGEISVVKVQGISSIKNKQMILKLEGGETVNADDVRFSSEGEALVYSTMLDMGVNAGIAEALVNEFKQSGVDAGVYALGIRDAYFYGEKNIPLSQLSENSFARNLSEAQRQYVYKLGQTEATEQAKAQQKAKDATAKEGKKTKGAQKFGNVIAEDGVATTKDGKIIEDGLTELQKESLYAINAYAKVSPINFHIFRSQKIDGKFVAKINGEVVEESANGVYMAGTNDIWIDLNAGDMGEGTMLWTASHEISHYIRERSPVKWKAMADYLMEEFGKNKNVSITELLDSQKAKILARKDASTKTEAQITDEAYEELVSDALSEMLVDGTVVDFLANVKQKDKSLWQTIMDAVADLLRRWGEVLGVYKGRTADAAEAQALRGMEKTYKKLQKMYAEAFAEANEVEWNSMTLEEVTEETENLIAMHNITEAQLAEAMEKGGIAAPSIAVTKKGITKFGEISLVFDKTSIDPNVSNDNKLYGSDAWTPNQTQLKKNAVFDEAKLTDAISEVQGILGEHSSELFDMTPAQIQDAMAKAKGDLHAAFDNNIGLQTAYALRERVIDAIPVNEDGSVDTSKLRDDLKQMSSGTGVMWGKYRRQFVEPLIDSAITSYDAATADETVSVMREKDATAKKFKLAEDGTLTVPAARYRTISALKANENKLSENADKAAAEVGKRLIEYANEIAAKTNTTTKDVVAAINRAYELRYRVEGVVASFAEDGIIINQNEGQILRNLYKNAVELPSEYFEAKAMRVVPLSEVSAVVAPQSFIKANPDIVESFGEMGVNVVAYEGGNESSRINSLNSLKGVRFSERGKNTAQEAEADNTAKLAEVGISVDSETGDVSPVKFSVRNIPGKNGTPSVENIAKLVSEATGRSYEESLRWVQAEYSIANIILGKPEFLDFDPDTRYDFIKKNSDYPQGTVDPNNLCRKREEFTVMFDMLQRMYPNKTFTALDVADMRRMLDEEGITVACGACFVEDRRQLLGEIADTFIGMWKEAAETGKPLQKTNASGVKKNMTVTAKLAKAYGLTKGTTIHAEDKYIPNQYDLTTYEGFKKLEREHPMIAASFVGYNNSRGQQAARLIEGRAEYTRQILNWSDKKVQSVNNQGGLRIFSFSDFKAISMLDIIQVIIDCSARGVKIQGYTKVPEFAKLIRNTGIKMNRSLMPKGETGIKTVNGKKVLDYDTKEGIDVNDKDFLDESDNPNVGNILVGINAEQIGLAFLDEFVDYIIPFHTNKSKAVCEALGLKTWQNYKESQHERDIASGKASKHNVNIYTQVIDKYNPTNKVEFVDAFLKECRKQKKVPRYAEFLNKEYKENGAYTDEGGSFDYTYREGYHKLLVDFKMSDKQGNILLQQNVTPDMDSSFMETILAREVEKKEGYKFPQNVFDRIQDKYGEKQKPAMKLSARNSNGETLSKGQQEYFKDSKVRDADGRLRVAYHGTPNGVFTEFKLSEGSHSSLMAQYGAGFYFDTDKTSAKRYTSAVNKTSGVSNPKVYEVYLNITNPLEVTDTSRVVTKEQLAAVIKRGNYEWFFTDGMPHELRNWLGKSKSEIQQMSRDEVINHWVDMVYERASFDSDILSSMVKAFKGESVVSAMREVFDKDGVRVNDRYGEMWIAWDANQIKETDNLNPTSNPDIRYSERNTDSNRSLLANALETTVQNDIEAQKLAQYKEKIDLIDAEQRKLAEINAEIRELSFSKGKRDAERLKSLRFDAVQTANRINTYDRQLLNLESTKVLKGVLEREKGLARKRQKQQNAEVLKQYREKANEERQKLIQKHQESRKKATEGRHKTVMKHKIRGVISELNTLLTRGNKEKNVKQGLQETVATAIASAELLFSDEITNEMIVRHGFTLPLSDRENSLAWDYSKALNEIAEYESALEKIRNSDDIGKEQKQREYLDGMWKEKRKLKNLDKKLADAFERERVAYNRTTTTTILKELASTYAKTQNAEEDYLRASYDDSVREHIENLAEYLSDEPTVRDMSLDSLQRVYKAYRMVQTVIRKANSSFKAGKSVAISTLGNNTMEEVEEVGGSKTHVLGGKIGEAVSAVKSFAFNNLKPVYFFERIGSKTLSSLFENVRKGEDTWAVDITEAKDFKEKTANKYSYSKWDFDKVYTFESTTGKKYTLSLEQIMSLYAYSKREQALPHLAEGGFVFDQAIETYKEKEDGKKSKLKYRVNTATAYKVSATEVANIIGNLTAEQKSFVDEMQNYLSAVMGAKGNEVTMEMYGVELFGEKFYFPLKSAKQYMFEQNEVSGEVKIKNAGFSKETKKHANNPVILSNFMDVWANHVNDMSMYHAFVLALEDFNRVFNYRTSASENLDSESVKGYIQNAYGSEANQYISQLLKDLNGGARVDSRENFGRSLVSRFKKASTFASLSVIIQQPSAVGRALAEVDAKYFDFNPKLIDHKKHWAEVKKYAPVAIIKEMGHFDTDMGRSSVDYIKGDQSIMGKADDVLSKPAAYMDELTWVHIWTAVKRETMARNKGITGEALLQKAGERFTEVITKTQVYDSVLSRSANMRSKSMFMNMLTAFMAEPTTSINMVEEAISNFKRGNKRKGARQLASVASSVVLNSLLVSLVYAARDDDEDETYLEKYVGSLTSELIDGLNPITYYPYLKDIWSIAQGYDVERSDMSIISKTVGSLKDVITAMSEDTEGMTDEELEEHNKAIVDAWLGVAGDFSSLFGIPAKNIIRDIKAGFNVYNTASRGQESSLSLVLDEVIESAKGVTPVYGWFASDSKTNKLYDAIIDGDTAYISRLKSGYKDEKAYNSAVSKGLRENDPRIREAAEARLSGDMTLYKQIALEIKGEGHFSQDTIVAAINSEMNALKKDDSSSGTSTSKPMFSTSDYYKAAVGGDSADAKAVKEYLIESGKTESQIQSSFNTAVKDAYEEGEIDSMKAVSLMVEFGGKTSKEADISVRYIDFKADYPDYADSITESKFEKYFEPIEDYGNYSLDDMGIGLDDYAEYCEKTKGIKGVDNDGDGKTDSGSKKAAILWVIDDLPLTASQKDALYYLNGWSYKTIYEAPWH